MKNCIQLYGDAIDVPVPSGGMISGTPYVFGSMIGVAGSTDSVVGDMVALWVVGVFRLPKKAGDVATIGEPVFWDPVAGTATVTAGALVRLGVATKAQLAGDATVDVRLGGAF